MKSVLAAISLVLLCSASVRAQTVEGHAVASFGGWTREGRSSLLGGAAVGAGVRLGDRFWVGGEAGVLAGLRGNAMLDFAALARVDLAPSSARVAPFVGAGYSRLYFFEGSANAVNFGAGLDITTSSGRMVRVEFRDIIRPEAVETHFWAFRIGVAFR
jgi:hypothetical protein